MPILPGLQDLFNLIRGGGQAAGEVAMEEARAKANANLERFITAHYARAEPLPVEIDLEMPVTGASVPLRLYAPESSGSPLPCHIYLHGGGFWLGTLDHFAPLCRALARDAQCVVVAVDYRLAPEHKFPTAAEDGYATMLWLTENSQRLGIDPSRLSIGGASAGGNLATVVAMMSRDRRGPRPVLQVLEIPVLDLSDWSPLSIPEEGIELPSGKDLYCRYYLEAAEQARLPYVSPLLAHDLEGLPPALILCAEYDPLAAEGKTYAERLERAGVPVEFHCWMGQFHGAQPMAALIPNEAAAYQSVLVAALRRAYDSA